MVKIHLLNDDYVFEIMSEHRSEKVQITHGQYKGKHYVSASITGSCLILEGEENLILKGNFAAVYIRVKSVVEKVAETLKDDRVYLTRIDAIPQGTERKILADLLN